MTRLEATTPARFDRAARVLAGFVIHGNAGERLEGALQGLRATCDYVVAVDSQSTDGSAERSRRLADRVVTVPWAGYGASRRAGLEALRGAGASWGFFLDSDEALEPAAVESLRRFAATLPQAARVGRRLARRNWVHGPRGTYLFSVDHRVRLFPLEAGAWTDAQIVHEAFPKARYPRLELALEHHFWEQELVREDKAHRYALLWAVQAAAEQRARPKHAPTQRLYHALRELLGHGALFRGGAHALRVAWTTAHYHGLKHRYLRQALDGGFPALQRAYAEGRFVELFQLVGPAVERLLAPPAR